MGLISMVDGFPPPRGGILGGRSQNRPGGGWLSNNVQQTARGFRALHPGGRNFGPAIDFWDALSSSEQSAWDVAAASLPVYDRYTTPYLGTGRQLSISYNTNLLHFGQGGSFVSVPPDPPTWGAVGSFEQKLDKDGTDVLAIVQAGFDAGTILACYGQPPGLQAIRLLRSQMAYMGNVLFSSGLAPGDIDKSIGDLYAANFGASVYDFEPNLWTMLYEIQGGFMRSAGDPCYTDDGLATMSIEPTGNPTSTTEALNQSGQSSFRFNNGLPSEIDVHGDLWGPIHPGETASVKIELPYDASQVVTIHAIVSNTPPSGQFKLGSGGPRVWHFIYNLP